jgi:hypothetical protein
MAISSTNPVWLDRHPARMSPAPRGVGVSPVSDPLIPKNSLPAVQECDSCHSKPPSTLNPIPPMGYSLIHG